MRIHFSGIGGSGLSALAQIAIDCGYEVSGDDIDLESVNIKLLKERGVAILDQKNVAEIIQSHQKTPINWLIYSAAVSLDDPILNFANSCGIKHGKRHEFINFVLEDKGLELIAIAGTHGKTTTTAMLVWLFKQLKIPIAYQIGSNITFGSSGQYQKNSKYFILECDEYDKNFLHFQPFISAITSLDYDHQDTYSDLNKYYQAFKQFINQSQFVFGWGEDVFDKLGFEQEELVDKFDVDYRGRVKTEHGIADLLSLIGQYNRENGELVYGILIKLFLLGELDLIEFDVKDHIEGNLIEQVAIVLNQFPGVKRRFEEISDNVYSDYAHHPAEIRAVLEMAKEKLNSSQN
jgi:UDP-N-acetylmuramate--alanine ligase